MFYPKPIAAVALAPILAFMSEPVRKAAWLLPLGPAVEMIRAAAGAGSEVPDAALAATIAAWVALAVAVSARECRNFARCTTD